MLISKLFQDVIETYVRLLLLSEMIEIPSAQDIRPLIESSSGDLRQIINTFQYLLQSSDEFDENFLEKIDSEHLNHELQTSSIFDTMFYSRLDEQCNSSSLKTFFDQLTENSLDQYKKSTKFFKDKTSNQHELFDTLKLFMQEQHINYIKDDSSFYLDYRPFIRQICQNEQKRAEESNPLKR